MFRIQEHDLLNTAADLLSEHGENTEYDRAIVELTTRLLGHKDSAQPLVESALRGLAAITRHPKE